MWGFVSADRAEGAGPDTPCLSAAGEMQCAAYRSSVHRILETGLRGMMGGGVSVCFLLSLFLMKKVHTLVN